jgi:hypothetical protein
MISLGLTIGALGVDHALFPIIVIIARESSPGMP